MFNLFEVVRVTLGLVGKTFSGFGITLFACSAFLIVPDAHANQLTWIERRSDALGLAWNNSPPTGAVGIPLAWQTVSAVEQMPGDGDVPQRPGTTFPPYPQSQERLSPEADRSTAQSPWIVGIGGGARIGYGEPTYPMVYARLGRMLERNASLSLRPRYIFGNSDLQGESNSEGAFQMPLTLDLKLNSWLNPYLGGGIATNTDSTGKTNGMISLGVDIMIHRNLALDLGMNYVFQPSDLDGDRRDLEFTSVLYLRF